MFNLLMVLQDQADQGGGGLSGLIGLVFAIAVVAALWMVFTKAGKPGWYAIIPILNTITIIQIAGKPWWWVIGLIIPIVNIVVLVIVMLELAKAFGKGIGFAIGLILLAPIFLMILGFGSSQYRGVPA